MDKAVAAETKDKRSQKANSYDIHNQMLTVTATNEKKQTRAPARANLGLHKITAALAEAMIAKKPSRKRNTMSFGSTIFQG